ncbi:MAG: dUTP diphosphatase [Chloroflexi bacterium]|nr:dUTP diphosphatase [Chloroflexota bacterium]
MQKQISNIIDRESISLPEGNWLQYFFDRQRAFADQFVHFDKLAEEAAKSKDVREDPRVEWTEDFIDCISQELAELRDWLPWKHWRRYGSFQLNEEEIKYELIDILHFLLDLFLVWGMTPEEVMRMYIAKMQQNIERQESGY